MKTITGSHPQDADGQKPASWYDEAFKLPAYNVHYTNSSSYFSWAVIADRILRSGCKSVLDIGCGPGQFASLLYDKGIKEYTGIDFSPVSIQKASDRCPFYKFVLADLAASDIMEKIAPSCVTALEVLEHIENDIVLLQKIPSATLFLGTVPNFPYPSHVRHFQNMEEVSQRYEALFSRFRVDEFRLKPDGSILFVMEGVKI